MAETIKLDPSAVATSRTEVDISAFISDEGVDWGDAQIEAYMADAERGSTAVDFRIPNRTVVIPLKLQTRGATSFDTIRRNVQAKTALFQKEGGCLSRQTSVGTLYGDIVNATLRLGGDWQQANKSVDTNAILTLELVPDWYGAEISLDDQTELTLPTFTKVLQLSSSDAVIAGDYPGRVRIVVDEDDADNQLGLLWGWRSRFYNSAATAALMYQAEALTPLDTAAIATVTGASGGGTNNVIQHANLSTGWTPVLSTQILSGSAHVTHQGTYRVWARCYSTSTTPPQVRFLWDVGDLSFPTENARLTIPGASRFFWLDLGEVRLDPPSAGTHRWQGVIQAKGAVGGENVSIDLLAYQPIDEGAGRVVGRVSTDVGLTGYSARDEFNQTSGNLDTKTLPVGGTWTEAGDTGNFTLDTTNHWVQRATTTADAAAGRVALAGATNYTNIAVQADVATSDNSLFAFLAIFARYVDTSNFLRARISPTANPPSSSYLSVEKRIAGVWTTLDSGIDIPAIQSNDWRTIRLIALATGEWFVYHASQGVPSPILVASGYDAVLATGGTLATGRVGITDNDSLAGTSATRMYDNFLAWVPAYDAAMFASQSVQLGTDGILREDSTGTAYAPMAPIGSLPRIPVSGLESRKVELFLKGSRGDFDQLSDAGIDDISARVHYRPSWLIAPGS